MGSSCPVCSRTGRGVRMRGYHEKRSEEDRAEAFIDLVRADVKAPGEEVGLGYWTNVDVAPGDVLETSTGRRYLITESRRTAGKDPHWETRAVVMEPGSPNPDGGTVHPLYWFPRNPKKAL